VLPLRRDACLGSINATQNLKARCDIAFFSETLNRHEDTATGGTLQLLHTLPRRSFLHPLLVLSLLTMNPRELVNRIRSGPALVVLNIPLRFRRRTWCNGHLKPCDFDKFLQALQSS
jgi:hypothetical protein